MKKVFFSLASIALLMTSCSDDKNDFSQDQDSVDMSDFYVYTDADSDESGRAPGSKSCFSMVNLNRQLNENPKLEEQLYNVEYHTRSLIASNFAKKPGNGNGNGNGNNGGGDNGGGDWVDNLGAVNIPVYVHVIYANSQQNISDAQINSQISVLNNDFNDTNYNDVPSEFQGVASDVDINFTLAGVYRHSNSTSSWGTNDAMKSAYPPITPETHLNIWVCNIGGGILGYAQFPGGNASTDGVVVSPQYFGTQGYVSAPFDGGRTTTHEVGHYLNLRHIWGDGRCRQDDFVADTPSSDRPNYGCPTTAYHCRSNDQFMNYMDYTDDSCMNMFTEGQKARMRSLFAPGGARESMLN